MFTTTRKLRAAEELARLNAEDNGKLRAELAEVRQTLEETVREYGRVNGDLRRANAKLESLKPLIVAEEKRRIGLAKATEAAAAKRKAKAPAVRLQPASPPPPARSPLAA